jgi:arylsulfatase A-like enzyme
MVENIILLTVDALSATHVGYHGYDRDTTPNLDSLVSEGTVYRQCVAQSSHTRESMPSLFFSQYPFELGEVGPVPDDRPTLTTALSEAGFETGG